MQRKKAGNFGKRRHSKDTHHRKISKTHPLHGLRLCSLERPAARCRARYDLPDVRRGKRKPQATTICVALGQRPQARQDNVGYTNATRTGSSPRRNRPVSVQTIRIHRKPSLSLRRVESSGPSFWHSGCSVFRAWPTSPRPRASALGTRLLRRHHLALA